MAKPKEKYPVATMPADALAYAESKKSAKERPLKEYVKETYKKLKVGDEVTVASDMGGPLGRYDFHGKVVKITDDAVMIEAPLSSEWRNYWRARLHRMQPVIPSVVYTAALANLTDLDPFGFHDWANKNLAKYWGGWFSRVELRRTVEGPVLRYILYKDDVDNGYVKELDVGKKPTPEQMAEALGVKKKPPPYGPFEKKEPPPEMREPIPRPGIIPPQKVEKGGKEPKKIEPLETKPSVKPPVGRVVSRAEIEKLEEKSTEELFNMITLDYNVPGRYKGYSYMGGVNGLQAGKDVAILQIILTRLGWEKLEVNGRYDERTEAAVRALQGKVGVTQDGYFGIDTKTALGEYLKMRAPPPEEEKEEIKIPPPPPKEEEVPKEEVALTLVLTREIDKDFVMPRGGAHAFFGKNFYIKTDAGWMTAGEAIVKPLETIDKAWKTDIETAKKIAPGEKWDKQTDLKRTRMGVTSWARTKRLMFPYLCASGQTFEFKLTGDRPLITEEGVSIPAGSVVQGTIKDYDEAGDGKFTVEITAVLNDFTVNGGKPTVPIKEGTKPTIASATAEEETSAKLPSPERQYGEETKEGEYT